MKKRNLILAAAAAMAMVAASTTASAGDVTYSISQNKLVSVAKVTKTGVTNTTISNIITTVAGDVTVPPTALLQAGDVITFTVANAKFDRANMAPNPVSVASAAVAVLGTQTLDATDTILTAAVTTSGTATATAATAAAAASTAIVALTPTYDLTASTSGKDITVTMTVSRTVLGVSQIVHKQVSTVASFVGVKTTASALVFGTILNTSSTATVASSFLKLATGGEVDATGLILTVPSTNVVATAKGDFNQVNAATKGTALIKLTNLPAGTTKVTWTPAVAAGAISQVTSAGTAPTTATAGSTFFLDGAGNGFASMNNAALAAGGLGAAPVVITLNGTTAVAPASVKIAVDYVAGVSDQFTNHVILAPTTFKTIVRNGSSFSVNSAGPLNTIKITDMSGSLTASTGKISVTAFTPTGAVAAGVSPTIPSLTSNSTAIIAMSTLTAAFPTAVRFDFVVESTQIVASNVKKSATGTTVTVYRNTTDSNGTTAGNGAI